MIVFLIKNSSLTEEATTIDELQKVETLVAARGTSFIVMIGFAALCHQISWILATIAAALRTDCIATADATKIAAVARS